MSVWSIVADALLALGVLIELMCCIGVVWMSNVFDRLHFAAASTTVGPVLILVAVLLTGMSSLSSLVQLSAAIVFLVLAGPVVTHATARAARRVHVGDLDPTSTERGAG